MGWEEGHGEDNQRCGGRRDVKRTTKGVQGGGTWRGQPKVGRENVTGTAYKCAVGDFLLQLAILR